jgi:EAL domain-containing protein (putative c-di-GMP-specific phosphodiesterase class I)
MFQRLRTKPTTLAALDEAVRRLARGEAAGIAVEGQGEIGRLAESFNAMAETIGERERLITQLAMSDAETGLPNRRALEAELTALAAAGESGAMAAAISIDRFAALRGVIGYELAAELLRDVAARLAERASAAMVGRLSSDTLGMIFHAGGAEAALAAAHALVASLEGSARVGEATVDLAVTIGLAAVGRPAPGERSPLTCAAIALDQARGARRAAALFDSEAYGEPADNLALMSQMLHAIETGLIDVYHQPKLDLRRGRVSGVEALVRWRHPTRGFLGPGRFVGLAEATGHIRALTDHVLARAIADQAAMRRAGHDLDVSVNISGQLLTDADFAEAALLLTDGAAGRVWFEIREASVIEQPERALRHVERFADAGVGVSIDNYGAGLSSLAWLREIRAEELKIDKTLILDLADDRKNPLLVRAAIDLAHGLGMKATAEGVETNEAFALLAGMGCDFAQGFLIERPMPLRDVLAFLAEDRGSARFG